MNLIINFLKNEKIWILKMLYGKHLLDFWNTCTQICLLLVHRFNLHELWKFLHKVRKYMLSEEFWSK